MKKTCLILLLLGSLGLLTTGLPYGVKGSGWRFKQEKTDVSVPDLPKEPAYGNEGVDHVGSETGGKDFSFGLSAKEEVETQKEHVNTGKESDLGFKPGSDYVPDSGPVEKLDPSYTPDVPELPKDSGLDYVPDKILPEYGPPKEGSDYVPDKISPEYEPPKEGSDYVPDKISPEYEPPKEGSDYVPDKISPEYVPPKEGSDYVPEKISPEYVPPDYVPYKVLPDKKVGSDYPKEELEPEYVPEKIIPHEKELDSGYGPDYKGLFKDTEYNPDQKETFAKGYEHPGSESFIEKLKRKWSEFTGGTKKVAGSVGRAIHTAVIDVKLHFRDLWDKFQKILSNFGYEIQRGAGYVFTVITTSIEEVKASAIIEKLEQRLEQGNEIVDEFFQKVGQKMTHWVQQHNHENIDEGLFLVGQQSKESNFMDIFQDKEIHHQVEKMVHGGVLTQEDADLLFQIKQTKADGDLSGSYSVPDQQNSGAYDKLNGDFDIFEGSGSKKIDGKSYGTESQVDKLAGGGYDNQDSKLHHTIKKELDNHEEVQDYSKGYGGHENKAINFPSKW